MISDIVILIPLIVSFSIVFLLMSSWIKKAKQIGLMWPDMNKINKDLVAGSGGIITVVSFVIGVLFFVGIEVFIFSSQSHLIEIFSLLVTVLFLSGIGMVDDILGWQRGGLSRRSRIILIGMAAIPLMVINVGRSIVSVPFFGLLDLGILYPLLLIPIGIVGASTTFNFLAGFNGLEAGNGVILISAMSVVAFVTGNIWIATVGLCMVFSLLAFLIFNFYPAKVFPGDSLTYVVGGLIAIMAILGNFEKIAIFFFIPYILEFVLKSRGKLIKHSFGKVNNKQELDMPYEKIYGLTHLSIAILKKTGIRATEKKVVFMIWGFTLFIVLIGFIIFKPGILV